MGLLDVIGGLIAYCFGIDTTEKPDDRKTKTYPPKEEKEKSCDSWYDNKKEYQLDFGAFCMKYINGYTDQQRQNFRHYWRLAEPCTPYPKTYRFYPSLDGL